MNTVYFTTNIAINALRRKTLDGKDYLVGPVVMAKECVMNGILYKAVDLQKSVPSWNGRIVTALHPKEGETHVSANASPDVYEQWGLGLLFNSTYDKKTTKLKSQVWLDEAKLKSNKEVAAAIDNGDMLEVSTGLFIDVIEEEGEFDGKPYTKVATNYRPDHLALLPGETGACSIDDGAGFPRANMELVVNGKLVQNVTEREIYQEVFTLLRERDKTSNPRRYPYVEDIFENTCVFSADEEGYVLYRVGINRTTTPISLVGDPVKVVRRVSYVDVPSTNATKTNNKKGPQMERKTVIDGLIAANKLQETDRERLMALTDEEFGSAVAALQVPAANTQTPPSPPPAPAKDTTPPAVRSNVEKDKEATAGRLYDEARTRIISKIKANTQNTFTDQEMSEMTLNQLEKLEKLATPKTADMTANTTGGVPTGSAPTTLPEPYVRESK